MSSENEKPVDAITELWRNRLKMIEQKFNLDLSGSSDATAGTPALEELSLNWLKRIAENPAVPHQILAELAQIDHSEIQTALAENPKLPEELLIHLCQNSFPDVRYLLAENHNLPVSALTILSEDENPYVATRAQWTLERLAQVKGSRKGEKSPFSASSAKRLAR